MFNAKDIDIRQLPFVCLESKNSLPKSAGVYLVLDETGKVRYIGLSKNIKGRWAQHHRMQEFSSLGLLKIAYLQVSDSSLLPQIEIALIQHFQPDLNKTKGGSTGGGSGDLIEGVFFRLNDEEFALLEAYCEAVCRTKSDVLRELIRRLRLPKKPS